MTRASLHKADKKATYPHYRRTHNHRHTRPHNIHNLHYCTAHTHTHARTHMKLPTHTHKGGGTKINNTDLQKHRSNAPNTELILQIKSSTICGYHSNNASRYQNKQNKKNTSNRKMWAEYLRWGLGRQFEGRTSTTAEVNWCEGKHIKSESRPPPKCDDGRSSNRA